MSTLVCNDCKAPDVDVFISDNSTWCNLCWNVKLVYRDFHNEFRYCSFIYRSSRYALVCHKCKEFKDTLPWYKRVFYTPNFATGKCANTKLSLCDTHIDGVKTTVDILFEKYQQCVEYRDKQRNIRKTQES